MGKILQNYKEEEMKIHNSVKGLQAQMFLHNKVLKWSYQTSYMNNISINPQEGSRFFLIQQCLFLAILFQS